MYGPFPRSRSLPRSSDRSATGRFRPGVEHLERRDNPVIPAGLTDVSALSQGWLLTPGLEWSETHTVNRSGGDILVCDEAGTGTAGTFTLDLIGSAVDADTAGGGGGGTGISVTTNGVGTGQFSYHLTMSGTYSAGVYTVTTETYAETGSYSVAEDITNLYSQSSSAPHLTSEHWDFTNTGNYTLSWSAAVSGGQLAYTAYSFVSSHAGHWHYHNSYSDGAYSDTTTDTTHTLQTTGGGSTGQYTQTDWWHSHVYSHGVQDDTQQDNESTSTTSGTASLEEPFQDVGVSWEAGTPAATNFTFHGVSSESASLSESVTSHTTAGGGWGFDVNSFSSASHAAHYGHVIDDEPGVPESGTGVESFHRDEAFTDGDDVTGGGSYVGGSANADFYAFETTSFAVANGLAVAGDHSTGYDEETGEPYDLVFNLTQSSSGAGNTSVTHNYHDGGTGLVLTGELFTGSAASQVNSRRWGARNGLAFDESMSTPDGMSMSLALPGSPGPVATPDGAQGAFPLAVLVPNLVSFTLDEGAADQLPWWWPTNMVPGVPGKAQDVYNKRVIELGQAGVKKGTDAFVTNAVLFDINDSTRPKGYGVITLGPTPTTKGPGSSFASGIKRGGDLDKAEQKMLDDFKELRYENVNLVSRDVQLAYLVDSAGTNPRSGDFVVRYKVIYHWTATKQNGMAIQFERVGLEGWLYLHDGKLERMDLFP